jgi:hypothetical protein
MYENNFKNKSLTDINDLNSFLQLIADLDEEIEFLAIGGTAMVLKNIKESTKDIDFLTTANYEKIKKLFELAGLREVSNSKICNIWYLESIRIDIFYDDFIMGTALPEDSKELSEYIKTIGKLKLYILNWYDIIITKIARSESRDIKDIIEIIKSQNINFNKLKKRYYDLAKVSLIANYDMKFKDLERNME